MLVGVSRNESLAGHDWTIANSEFSPHLLHCVHRMSHNYACEPAYVY